MTTAMSSPSPGCRDTSPRAPSGRRNPGIDAFRFIAVAAVVLLHSLPPGPGVPTLGVSLTATACRFAVPFFFVVSGYFLRTEGRPVGSLVVTPLLRLAPVYLVAIALYFAAWHAFAIEPWQPHLRDLRNGGPAFHLWFLPALGISLAAVGLGDRVAGLRVTAAACVLLAAAGLALTSYRGLYAAPIANARSGWLFGPLCVTIGLAIARSHLRLRWPVALSAALACYALLAMEELMLARLSYAPFQSHDFMAMTFPFGAAMLLLALAWGERANPATLARAGRLTLGIYVFHLLFLRLLRPLTGTGDALQIAILALGTLACTVPATALMARLPLLRRMVL